MAVSRSTSQTSSHVMFDAESSVAELAWLLYEYGVHTYFRTPVRRYVQYYLSTHRTAVLVRHIKKA